ncbi:hypothetical protein FRC12_013913 [Ceratobasidium sp. 428]|nr:hypothetical protein FRC12_013913 [Ceratobasidium sp. 428]
MPSKDTPPGSPQRSSSPGSIRDTQPRSNSPTTTERGTQPHHALYDTPPEGTQPPELERSQRPRTMSRSARETAEYKIRSKSTTKPKSNPGAPRAAVKKRSRGRTLRFDGEVADNDINDEDGDDEEIRVRKSRKTGHADSQANSPPPKPPGRHATLAREDRGADQPVTVEAGIAREIGDLFGFDLASASATTVRDTIRSLPNNSPPPVGPARRYPQVQSEASVSLPLLKKSGGYYRERLDTYAPAKKRVAADDDPRPTKRPRDESRGSSLEIELDPDADKSDPDLNHNQPPSPPPPPPLPPLPSFLLRSPRSTSTTQRADIWASQSKPGPGPLRYPPDVSGYRRTPVPEPKTDVLARRASQLQQSLNHAVDRAPNRAPDHAPDRAPNRAPNRAPDRVPNTEPGPRLLAARATDRTSGAPTRETTRANAAPRPAPSSSHPATVPRRSSNAAPRPQQPVASTSRPSTSRRAPTPPNAHAVTDGETEDEPWVKSNKRKQEKRRQYRLKKKARDRARNNSPEPDARPTERRQDLPSRAPDDPVAAILSRIEALLESRGDDLDAQELDSLVKLAADLAANRATGQPLSRAGPGPSSQRNRANSPRAAAQCPAPDDEEGFEDDDPVVLNKNGLGRYPGTRGKVASRAIPLLLSTAACRGVYQGSDTNIRWARRAYRRAWDLFCPDIEFREPPYDLLQTISLRISNLRTEIKKRIRKVVEHLFEFAPGSSDAVLRFNKDIATRLGHNTFHCKDLVVDTDQYEHPVFIRAICEAFFWSAETFLLRDKDNLDKLANDGIPLPAIALVLTLMQECIEEWDTGRFRPRDLNDTNQEAIFDAHLQGLLNYRSGARGRLAGFRVTWFEAGLEYAHIKMNRDEEDHDGFCQSITRVENVRPDSDREFDNDEDEDEDEEPELVNGRYTAKSKGKQARR